MKTKTILRLPLTVAMEELLHLMAPPAELQVAKAVRELNQTPRQSLRRLTVATAG
jgi:hypothetical protein